MTLHSAKGLEFDTVFLPGWEEELFPHKNALKDQNQGDNSQNNGIEEERRLAYVGITRARKRAVISYCSRRYLYNSWIASQPSRFIGELPADAIQHIKAHNYAGVSVPKRRPPALKTSAFKPGDSISHASYGQGIVQSTDGERITILFKSGKKHILQDYIKKSS